MQDRWSRYDDLPEHSGEYLVTYIDELGRLKVTIAELVYFMSGFAIQAFNSLEPSRANNDGHRWHLEGGGTLPGIIGWREIPPAMNL